jgi:hypothetical protein
MADLNIMATNIKNILSTVPGIEQAYDHEPQTMTDLPSATLYFDGFTLVEETGGKDSVNWQWTIRIYVPLNTSDVQDPQLKLRNLIMDTIRELRKDISLGNSCYYHTISNADVYALIDQANPMMVAEITVVATTGEIR